MEKCIDHLEFINNTCPDCGLQVDAYGNTEDQFDYCSFPDCGCDGSRLCMASNGASERAISQNVEAMWTGKTIQHCVAVLSLISSLKKEK